MRCAVILVGFMGAGKTTVGRILAQKLGWQFADLDDRICAREGRSVPEIFRDSGEAYFRQVETECLGDALQPESGSTNGVLALGGGAFVQPRNAELIRMSGIPVVFLDAAAETLFQRCAPQVGERPLLADENQFRQLYEARREDYMRAGVRIDTTALGPEQVAAEIAGRLDLAGYS